MTKLLQTNVIQLKGDSNVFLIKMIFFNYSPYIIRYYVNDQIEIIVIGDRLHIVDKTESNDVIKSELLRIWSFFTYAMYMIDCYDEKKNEYLLWKLAKVYF